MKDEELTLNDSILTIKRMQEHLTYEERQYLIELADRYVRLERIKTAKEKLQRKIDDLKAQIENLESNN